MYEYPIGSGNWHRGIHKPMITEDEYDRIQMLLGRQGKPRPKSHIFDFAGMMRCGECNAMITVEEKYKHQKNGKIHHYIYYHCTKRKNPNCSQGSIEEAELNRQINAAIDKLVIPPEFHDFGMRWFRAQNENESSSRNAILATRQEAYKLCIKKIDGYIDMRAAKEITAEQYAQRIAPLEREKAQHEEFFADMGQRIDQWIQTADEMFTFLDDAKEKFKTGTLETKRQILSTLGSNLVIKDKILTLDVQNTLLPMEVVSEEAKKIYARFEPVKSAIDKRKLELAYSKSPRMLRRQDSNLRPGD
ncbi:MAG: recombinase zinc beta ribbon domain-containing protein [Candidatus Sungbacteria bacterium]|uniref:Recombinase zinc beta ribbon domain-containing protein n=1 Tax=Candidatus Sungiibacteriota bacterium TaxID=2750080 RepID=A0A9D6QVT7_9BACT|nr:recombinase zinc beta ribbon domain-containing protein [Candidatus Sungbacteria bacterium]